MLLNLLRSGFDPLELIIDLFAMAFVVFCTMPVHEYAHALIATKLGDQTPRLSGRLTLNPMAHISPLGAAMIFLVGFGYAKPVSVNPRNFKDPKKGMALTAIAGPISNLIMAFIFLLLAQIVDLVSNGQTVFFQRDGVIFAPQSLNMSFAVCMFLYYAGVININLAVFNLLPIPPLDGSRILQLLIPAKYYYRVMQYERYIILAVFFLLFTGILSYPISFLSDLILDLFMFFEKF